MADGPALWPKPVEHSVGCHGPYGMSEIGIAAGVTVVTATYMIELCGCLML